MTPEGWAAILTAVSAAVLQWISNRDARHAADDVREAAETDRLRADVAALAKERDDWRDRYYALRDKQGGG